MQSSDNMGEFLRKNISPGLRGLLTLLGVALLVTAWILTWFNWFNGLRGTLLTLSIIILIPRLMIAAHDAKLVDPPK